MRIIGMVAAGLMASTSSIALAQDVQDDPEVQDEFGAEVSAYAQENAQNGGIGDWVSEQAQARGAGDDEDEGEVLEVESEDDLAESEGIGANVSAAARGAAQDESREGGVAQRVLAETPAAQAARDAVARASEAAATGRAQAETARQSAGAARAGADTARQQAQQARLAAQNARENAREARGRRPGG